MSHFLSDKPPIEDLQYFLEFQISRVWAPEQNNLQGKDPVCQSLHFSLMGPKLYISPNQVSSLLLVFFYCIHVMIYEKSFGKLACHG